MAFHLHRLKLVGRPLHAAGWQKADAADLAAGRLALTPQRVEALAVLLGVARSELLRNPTPQEQREWSFYRAAAAQPALVWDAARALWSKQGLRDDEAAVIMGFKPITILNVSRRPFALSSAALRLTTALSVAGGPEVLLPPQVSGNQERDR